MRWKHYAKVTRKVVSEATSPGSNWNFDDGSGASSNPDVIYEQYPCNIKEDVTSYDTSEKGQSFTGKAELKGMLTNKLMEGDIIDGQYKIVGRITHPHNKHTKCNLVRIR